jgi:uncharacterized membrane protein YhaH (DUF805 family)
MSQDASLFWLFFGFKGRINRKAFLLGGLAMVVITLFVIYRGSLVQENEAGLNFWTTVLSVVAFVSLWCQTALAAKRLHDMGRPGLLALTMFVPFLNFLAFVFLCLIPGTPGPNRFGPAPNLPG